MDYDFIPKDVEQFIVKSIDSIAQLEGLLLLRSDQMATWSVESLAKRLYISEAQTVEIMSHLCAEGLLMAKASLPRHYQYHPKTAELREMVDRVAEIYAKHLVPVTNLIHSKPKTNVQKFADAFRLRKDE